MVDTGRLLKTPVTLFLLTISFLSSGLFINVIQLALYVCVRPLDKRLFHALFQYTRYWMLSQLVFLAEWWGGMELVCYEDNMAHHMGREHAVCVLNHRYEIDWLAVFTLCDRLRLLANLRAFAKKALQYIPILGSSLRMGGDVFLERNWEKDKDIIGRQVTELAQYQSPMWLMVAAEGTRFTEAKHEASLKFAREKGLPELRHHLTPRTKGFTHTVPHLRGTKVEAVYDVQLAFKRGIEPSILGLMKGEKYEAHFYVNRIPISSLPEGEEELSNWMHELYQKKDKMMDSFLKTGDFFLESGVAAVPAHRVERRCCSLLNTLFWAVVTLVPIASYLVGTLMSGSLVAVGVVLAVTALIVLLVTFMVRATVIKKGSAYGADSPAAESRPNKTE